MIKETLNMEKPIKRIILAAVLIVFLALSFFGFNYLSKQNAAKKAKEDKYLNYLTRVKSAPHIALSQDQRMKTLENSQDDFEGTGITFSINADVLFISEVFSGSPADKAGLKTGDRITRIDDKCACEMAADQVSAALKGERGTKVTLNIYRDSFGGYTKDFVIVKDLVDNSGRREYLAFLKEGKGGENLGDNYMKFKDKVYYWHDGGGRAVSFMAPTEINKEKIETFNGGCIWNHEKYRFDPCDRFAKDDRKVYYASLEIKGADPETFELIERGNRVNLSRDRNHVFYGASIIENADPETFKILSYRYEKDNARVYFGQWEIEGADSDSFLIISNKNGLAKDKDNYYSGTIKSSKDEFEKLSGIN